MKNHNLEFYSRMHSKTKYLIIPIVASISFAIGCTTALYIPTHDNVLPNANIAELQRGRQLYINNCGSCHTLYLPEKYSTEQWSLWIKKMKPKVKITDEENTLILKYVSKGQK